MACPDCGGVLEERHKTDMLNGGEWIATAPEKAEPTRRGYHISALYSPIGWKSWAKIARQWVEAQGHPKKLQAFVNNVLAETWEEDYAAKLDAAKVAERAEAYELLFAPRGVLVATSGIDVQPNRVEIQTIGWGEGEEAWVLNYAVVYGDPTRFELWGQVLDVIRTPIRHASGVLLQPYCAAVDSGDGNLTNEVYTFARENREEHVLAIKGFSGARPPIGSPSKQDINIRGQKIPKGSTLYGRLKRSEKDGPGVVHFPLGLHEDYFKQLTAEKQATKFINGMPRRRWVKQDGDRNEALDTFVYAYAALHYAYTRHNRATFWKQMRAVLEEKASRLAAQTAAMAESSPEAPLAPPVVVQHGAGRISLEGSRRFSR
jgi:phage terminase large subunit GpA-like protein